MRRILIVVLLLICFIGTASATNLIYDMQNPNYNSRAYDPGLTYRLIGNNYDAGAATTASLSIVRTYYIVNYYPMQATYWAFTYDGTTSVTWGSGGIGVAFFDSNMNALYAPDRYYGNLPYTIVTGDRVEFKKAGSIMQLWVNGVHLGAYDTNIGATNPSYFAIGNTMFGNFFGGETTTAYYDDVVIGTDYLATPPTVLDVAPNNWYIQNNVFTGARGLYDNLGNPQSSDIISVHYAKPTSGYSNLFMSGPGGYDVQTINTSGYAGTAVFNMSYIWNNNTPMGSMYWSSQGDTKTSDTVPYTSTGATVMWDRDTYQKGDTAIIHYAILGGDFWNTSGYHYQMSVVDLFGQYRGNTSITVQSGDITYPWPADAAEGAYLAEVIAVPNTAGLNLFMGYDIAQLTGFFAMNGTVKDGQTGAALNGANVSFVQGSVISNTVTGASGKYYATNFTTGSLLYVNVTATGYKPLQYSFTPLTTRTVDPLDFPLNPLAPSGVTGAAIGGVARTTPYGEPITNTLVWVQNVSNGEYHQQLTNAYGWYACDDSRGCNLVHMEPYTVWGSRSGYGNSTFYTVVV